VMERCGVSPQSLLSLPHHFFAGLIAVDAQSFFVIKMILYPLLETRGGQFTCGVAGAVMKRDEGANGMRIEGASERRAGHYGISLIASKSPARRLVRAAISPLRSAPRRAARYTAAHVYNRAARASRLFDRFNYTRKMERERERDASA